MNGAVEELRNNLAAKEADLALAMGGRTGTMSLRWVYTCILWLCMYACRKWPCDWHVGMHGHVLLVEHIPWF
jgi:hypothetical protein